jgi:hypothetical protein
LIHQKALINAIEGCYAFNLYEKHQYQDDHPLVSVYTGTYNTGDFLRDTYQSLRDQTCPNWEWVVVDDHSTDGTWEHLEQLALEDVRVRPVRNAKNNGKIGSVKDTATRLCRGEFLVELDCRTSMKTDSGTGSEMGSGRIGTVKRSTGGRCGRSVSTQTSTTASAQARGSSLGGI